MLRALNVLISLEVRKTIRHGDTIEVCPKGIISLILVLTFGIRSCFGEFLE